MIADPVKKWVPYWYEKLQMEAWARVKKPRPKSVPSDTTFENQRRTKWYAFGTFRPSWWITDSVAMGWILLQKSFYALVHKIFEPLASFSCKDVGGRMISR